MEDTTSQDESKDWPSPAEQQEVMERGLRILARMIAHAHLQRQGLLPAADAVTEATGDSGHAAPALHGEGEEAEE